MLPDPICAFDIAEDGTATPCALGDPPRGAWRWVHMDLNDPGLEAWLCNNVPESIVSAVMQTETRPRFDKRPEGVLINLRGVNLNDGAEPEDMVALRIWAARDLVVTLRRRRIMALDALRIEAETGSLPATPASFLSSLADGLTRRIETVAEALEDRVDDIEEAIFGGHEIDSDEMLDLRQMLIKLKRYVGPQKTALSDFANAPEDWLTPEVSPYVRETANRAARTIEGLEAANDRMHVLQDHLDARADAALGRHSYILSIIAAIFLPLSFLTGLFGVNIAGMPGTAWPRAFATLTLASAVTGLGLFLLFRWLKWL